MMTQLFINAKKVRGQLDGREINLPHDDMWKMI
jgi:hypothetical protein